MNYENRESSMIKKYSVNPTPTKNNKEMTIS